MKIAIHHRPGSFSERWIEYCKKEGVQYKIVDCFRSDIIGCKKEKIDNQDLNIQAKTL